MTTPDVPLRMEITVELDAPPERVWDAIATGAGITSWFLPTDVDEREGGTILTHMGETDSSGTVTGWEPHRRFAIEEPEWAALGGHDDAAVTPLATEFLVEAQSGGTTVVRVVSSAFGTGADWEEEFFEEMERSWRPFFERLRLYLAHFPGQYATPMSIGAKLPGTPDDVLAAMRDDLGVGAVGDTLEARRLTGRVEQATDEGVLVRMSAPVPGFFAFAAWPAGDGTAQVSVQGQFFSADAPSYVEKEGPNWQSWLESLDLKSTSAATTER